MYSAIRKIPIENTKIRKKLQVQQLFCVSYHITPKDKEKLDIAERKSLAECK